MEIVEKTLLSISNFIFFVLLTMLFLPSFLIVTFLESTWKKKLGEVFGL